MGRPCLPHEASLGACWIQGRLEGAGGQRDEDDYAGLGGACAHRGCFRNSDPRPRQPMHVGGWAAPAQRSRPSWAQTAAHLQRSQGNGVLRTRGASHPSWTVSLPPPSK